MSACPICAKPSTPDFRPFCSKRCADVDLARWLGGTYRIGGSRAEDGADETALPDLGVSWPNVGEVKKSS